MNNLEKMLSEDLEKLKKSQPEDECFEWWSGCNYHINRGFNEFEPIGTATSMHNCDVCDRVFYCKIKQSTPIWLINDEVKKNLKQGWIETIEIERNTVVQ